MSHEFDHIAWLRRQLPPPHGIVSLGPGDDAAELNFLKATRLLVSVDMLMEGVHFQTSVHSPSLIGRKALAVNLSDIAAMAGVPRAAFVAVSFPRGCGTRFCHELEAGIQRLADEFEVQIAGGDTNSWNGPLVISVTILGEATSRGSVRRSGAQVGDWIFVTGPLGGSLSSGRHLSFTPRIQDALLLQELVQLHAMADISDGLVADLGHILEESSVGAVLDSDRIPIHPDVPANLREVETESELTRLGHALGDGEDFELVFTTSAEDGRRLTDMAAQNLALTNSSQVELFQRLTKVGEIVEGEQYAIRDEGGSLRPVPQLGWKHDL